MMNKYILVSHNCPTTGINYKQDSLTAAETVSGKQGQHTPVVHCTPAEGAAPHGNRGMRSH